MRDFLKTWMGEMGEILSIPVFVAGALLIAFWPMILGERIGHFGVGILGNVLWLVSLISASNAYWNRKP
jgi:hypothetical protein